MEYVLKTKDLKKTYGNYNALNGLSMNVPKGSIYGLIGRNGVGKTTLIRLICGLQKATEGDFSLSYYAIFKEKGITPNINLCEQIIVRSVDKTALLRIFNNVIDNAIKYSEGDLTISLFENGKIVFSNHTSDLNEIQIGKLFDRFYTVNTARKSTGLGLSIAKALIEKMDGNISADYSNNVLSIIIKLNEV